MRDDFIGNEDIQRIKKIELSRAGAQFLIISFKKNAKFSGYFEGK